MLAYVSGDLFESPARTLVNTVNTVGVMGKGIAYTFRRVYPEMFKQYQALCETGDLRVGSLFLYRTPTKLILNFPTKQHWRSPSKPEYIEAGLRRFVEIYQEAAIHSVAFPPLGCGNGELDFPTIVRPIMEQYLRDLPIPVYIYAPRPATSPPEHCTPDQIRAWLQTEPALLPFLEVWHDLQERFSEPRLLTTLSRGTEFEAELIADEDKIRVRASGKTTSITKSECKDAWRELRAHKLATATSLLPHCERDAAYLLPILAELPYVEPVQVAERYDYFTFTPQQAIQLTPHTGKLRAKSQLALSV